MPIIMLPNPGMEASVARPVTLDIAAQVMEIIQIPSDTRIIFPGDSDSVYQSGSLVTDKDNTPYLAGNSSLTIEVSERLIEEALGTIAVYQPEHTPFFYDDKLGIAAKMVYIPTEVTINFRYKARSAAHASKIRHDTWARVSNMRDVNIHTVSYNMPITGTVMDVLKYLHALREANAGYNESFEDYFLSYASPFVTQISKMDGTNPTYTIQETATRILGLFDFTGTPEKAEKDGESSTWNLEFTYKFTYEKPTNQVLKFPIAIHNQLVDQRLFTGTEPTNFKTKKKFYSSSIKHFREFESDRLLDKAVGEDRLIMIPSYDDIIYDNKVINTETIFSAVCSVEEPDKSLYLNLNELGDFHFNEKVLEYIKEVDYQWIYKPFQSFLNVSGYRNSYLAHHESIVVDKSLDVRSTRELDPRVINRIRIGIVDNILEVDPKAIFRLLKYPEVLRILVLATRTHWVHLERLRPIVDLTKLFPDMDRIGPPRSLWDTNRKQINTVLTSSLQASRISDGPIRGKNVKLYEQIYGKHSG